VEQSVLLLFLSLGISLLPHQRQVIFSTEQVADVTGITPLLRFQLHIVSVGQKDIKLANKHRIVCYRIVQKILLMYKTGRVFVHTSNQQTPKLLFIDDCILTVPPCSAALKTKWRQERQKVSWAWTSTKNPSKASICRYQIEIEINMSDFYE